MTNDTGMNTTATNTPPPRMERMTGGPLLQIRLKGQYVGHRQLNQPRITLGRSVRSDIVLESARGVSRNHAHILIIDDEVVIEDLASRNGTFVNGRVCKRRTLRHGDRISIGRYRLRYRASHKAGDPRTDPRPGLAELLRMWRAAAVTQQINGCPGCAVEPGMHGPDPGDMSPTDALPRIVDTDAGTDETQGASSDEAQSAPESPAVNEAVPSGVASMGDTVNSLAIRDFK